ncbi:MAG: YkgJ family cysteine cluster protein [Gammaproteobacteria bacterium]|nr:YkgJ family cysteine cluster protein [Gammaproteobacteria bacterium]
MQCRKGCGACCIAPSISTAIPGMAKGKPAGERCIQLNENNCCKLFAQPSRPEVCLLFQADEEFCGDSNVAALKRLSLLQQKSTP